MASLLQKFKITHEQLQQLLGNENCDHTQLQHKITQYIALMVEEDKTNQFQQQMFDYFCERNGVSILARLLKVDTLLAIKSYSLLFINLKDDMWISYILCQPFLTEAIQTKCDSDEEEWTEYFVSFLKSLSIRLNASQATLFFNKKCCRFPLIYEAMKFFNHPDFMVRTSVMNIILEIMKIKQQKTQEYFSRFPFTAYLVTFACEVHQLISSHVTKIAEGQVSPKYLQNYSVDLSDYLYYFNDLMEFGNAQTVLIIENLFISYIIIPTFKWLQSDNQLIVKQAFLLCLEYLRIIKNDAIKSTIIFLLFSPNVNSQFLQRIKSEQVYYPKVYQQPFNPNQFYWSHYDNEITDHCLQIFQDVINFKVDFQTEKHNLNPEFLQEVNSISQFIGFNIITNKKITELYPLGLLGSDAANNIINPFNSILKQWLSSIKSTDVITSIIVQTIFCKNNLYKMLKDKQLQNLSERQIQKSTVIEDNEKLIKKQTAQNGLNRDEQQFAFLDQILLILQKQVSQIKWDEIKCIVLQNTLMIFKKLVKDAFSLEFEEELLKKYRQITQLLKDQFTQQNLTCIVQSFQKFYKDITPKFTNHQYQNQIPYVTLFLPQQKWVQVYPKYALPRLHYTHMVHYIQHFLLFRAFITHYFNTFYQVEYVDFGEEYSRQFLGTQIKWKKGQKYQIAKKTLIPCQLQIKGEKKGRKALIIEDNRSLVVAEIQFDIVNCKIILNCDWKSANFDISKEDGNQIQIVTEEQKLVVSFEDQIRSNTTMTRLSDLKWQRYQQQSAFIYKFVKQATDE